jgi:signal transduction histidine kinase
LATARLTPRGETTITPCHDEGAQGGSILDGVVDDERWRRWLRSHEATVDAALVALVLAAFEMPAFDPYRHGGGPWWPLWGLVVATPLLWRRRFPISVLAVSLAGTAGALVTRTGPDWGGLSLVALFLGAAVALANAASRLPTHLSRRLALGSAVVIVATSLDRSLTPDVVAAQVVFVAAAWLAGEGIRARRSEVALLHDQAAHRAEQAAADERERIARELHDAVAHQLTVVAVQAGAARLVADEDPASRQVLVTIEEAARQALSDLRRALGVVHRDDRAGGITPPPSLQQLDRLAERLRSAGLPLELSVTGDPARVPDGVAVSAYRIIQEALTNVLTHAGQVATRVQVVCRSTEIQLDVHNDRPPAVRSSLPDGGGNGLIGMRERVAAYGGSLEAGAVASGGFRVTARIPIT